MAKLRNFTWALFWPVLVISVGLLCYLLVPTAPVNPPHWLEMHRKYKSGPSPHQVMQHMIGEDDGTIEPEE